MNDKQLLRYSRHILLNEIGIENQQKLIDACVLVVGCGGLAAAALPYLVAAGIGKLIIADHDHIDDTNLQRQITYTEQDVGCLKVASMASFLKQRQTDCQITAINKRLNQQDLIALLPQCDVILDCSDNYETRHTINHATQLLPKPLISAAVTGFKGQIAIYRPDLADSACYACLFHPQEQHQQSCATFGVYSPIVGIIGSFQAAEAMKIIMGLPTQHNQLFCYDGLSNHWQTLRLTKRNNCPICQKTSNN